MPNCEAGRLTGILAFLAGGLLDSLALGDRPALILWVLLGLGTAIALNVSNNTPSREKWWSVLTSRWLFLVPALSILLLLLLFPGARQRNLALVSAHKLIYQARTTGQLPAGLATTAITELNHALESDPDNPELLGALASLYAWSGAPDASLAALQRRVLLDEQDPLARYAPFLNWKLILTDQPPPEPSAGLLRIYKPWRNRFPDRAESYVLAASVWWEDRGNGQRANTLLEEGLRKGAEPRELLLDYLHQIKTGS